jgi:hypothetical protein
MKLLTYTEFLKLPCPVLYCEWRPAYCGQLRVKVDILYDKEGKPHDFCSDGISDNLEYDDGFVLPGTNTEYSLDFYATQRDGCGKVFVDADHPIGDGERLFWVYSKEEVNELIGKLNRCCL